MDNLDSHSPQTGPDTPDNLRAKLAKERKVGFLSRWETLLLQFSAGERLVLYGFTATLAASALMLLVILNMAVSVTLPAPGGSLVEGEIGPARFINPILTISQPDEDLTALVYSGLMRALPDGSIVPDLASSYSISPDGTTYTFHIRTNDTFQDGTPVTSADVAFTVSAAQNPDIKSPRRADWEGVTVSTPDAHTVIFTLPHPYAPFIENATLGILPKHLWQNVSSEEFPFSPLNTHPVGSGPYRFSSLETDSTGSATRYDVVPFNHYALGEPNLSHITLLFYPDTASLESAFNAGRIDAIASVMPSDLSSLKRDNEQIVEVPLPRVFGVFFNQSHSAVLADASVRAALDTAVDKQSIINSVLGGYGAPLDGPIPPGSIGSTISTSPIPLSNALKTKLASSTDPSLAQKARTILQNGGWSFDTTSGTWKKKKEELSFTLATADEPELVATANAVANDWRNAGVKVAVQVYPLSELNTKVIRPRNYDALLFGEVVGRELDLFAFWHSSQRNDPGLNLAMYANTHADALLSQARATTDTKSRDALYTQFASIIATDEPAVFLYAPEFLYVIPQNLQGVALGALTTPAERFLNVYQWYTQTQHVWNIFVGKNNY